MVSHLQNWLQILVRALLGPPDQHWEQGLKIPVGLAGLDDRAEPFPCGYGCNGMTSLGVFCIWRHKLEWITKKERTNACAVRKNFFRQMET